MWEIQNILFGLILVKFRPRCIMYRGHPLVGVIGLLKKKRRNLYLLPSYNWRLLALPINSRTATQKPTLVYAINAFGDISPEISCRMQDNYISTGIYRCSILDY